MESLEQRCMEEIYKEHYKAVYNYLFCLYHDKSLAEELTQETFYRAIKGINKFRGDCKIRVWLCQIAKHALYEELKRRKKERMLSLNTEIGDIEDIKSDVDLDEGFIEKEQRMMLYKLIDNLNEPIKNLMYLKLTTGLTYKDIALLVGKSETWARVTYYRTKEKLIENNRKEEQ